MHRLPGGLRWTQLLYAPMAAILFLAGFSIARGYGVHITLRDRAEANHLYTPTFSSDPGPQLVMVYIGSATCPWSNRPELPDAIEEIKASLSAYARRHGLGFKAEGVALDWDTRRGVDHLSAFGLFGEIAAGGNWGGNSAIRYLWSGDVAIQATPTVLVYARTFVAPRDSIDLLLFGEANRRVVLVKTGLEEIIQWVEAGVPLPESPAAVPGDPAEG